MSGARGIPPALSVGLLVVGLAACGGSSHKSSSAESSIPSTAPTAPTTTTPKPRPAHVAAKVHKSTTTHPTTSTTTAATTHATTTPATTKTAAKAPSPTTPAYTPPVHATLVGQNHSPTVNKLWGYSLTVTDAKGRPLSGTVDVEFTFNGQVVGHDTPPTDPITDGHWHEEITFPPDAIGEPIAVQAVVHTSIGSITLDWPVKAQK